MVSSPRNFIGGRGAGEANTIAFNAQQGVTVDDFGPLGSAGNRIFSNSIFSNGRLGIDLLAGEDGVEGPTPNDPRDPDQGSNTLQNKPVLSSATTAPGELTVRGKLNSTPNETFVLQFFSNPDGGEGKVLLGQKTVSTNANGDAAYEFSFARTVPKGQSVTATATGAGNTSEFSAPRVAVAQ